MDLSSELDCTTISIETFAAKAMEDDDLCAALLEALRSKKDTIRFNGFSILYHISKETPMVLYPRWEFFAELLKSSNSYHQLIAVRILANLTTVDTENKFAGLFDTYFNLLNKSVIVAGHVAGNAGKIARAQPQLQQKIIHQLLHIDATQQKHKDLVKAYAIEAFDEFFDQIENKQEILAFVKQQVHCTSPKTKTIAASFLKKWNQ